MVSKPQAPTPTDPQVSAAAQTQSNEATARLQSKLNNVSSQGPQGSVTYSQTSPDQWLQTTQLSPAEQGIFDQSTQAQQGALGIANTQLGRIDTALGSSLNPSQGLITQAPQGGAIGQVGTPQTNQGSFNQGGPIQTQIGNQNINQSVQGVQNAYYNQAASRLDPQYAQAQSQLETKLANQGLNSNDASYQTALANFNRSKTDAYNQANFGAIGAGATEQNTLFGQQAQQGQFANQAVGQQYSQGLGAVQQQNAAANANYQNELAGVGFNNQAQAQQYNQAIQGAQFQNQAQGQQFQQTAYAQNQPINQFSALLGQGQVSMPQGVQYTPTSVQPTDVLGAYALNAQQQQQQYQAQSQQQSGLLGGLFSLGSSALLSDRRLKRDIVKLGELPDGLGVYAYRYVWDRVRHVGVMAQEVARLRPWALRTLGGWLAVDYGAL